MESGMISVDKWSSGSQAYFLTHLHADHTAGLHDAWRCGPLYCSRLTAKLLPCKFPDFDLSLLRIVDIGTWYSLSLTSSSSASCSDFLFKAIDAQHCPGSVMYLFRGELGCTLYTGDFRWETSSKGTEYGRTMLLDALKNETLDTLYLDNTYCNPQFSFPPREVSAKQVVDIITSHPDHEIIIAIDSVGKEDLLLHISEALNIKIWVWPERLQIMHLLGFHQNFTTQTSLTRVRAVPRYSFSIETLEALNTHHPTIGIMPSGLPWSGEATKDGNMFGCSLSQEKKEDCTASCNMMHGSGENSGGETKCHDCIFQVPYSAHSCYSEIQEIVELLRPVKIKGIVHSTSCHTDPSYYFDHLCGDAQAQWRVQQKLENEEILSSAEVAEINPIPVDISPVAGRKRKIYQKFLGIRINRVRFLRRLSRVANLTDAEE